MLFYFMLEQDTTHVVFHSLLQKRRSYIHSRFNQRSFRFTTLQCQQLKLLNRLDIVHILMFSSMLNKFMRMLFHCFPHIDSIDPAILQNLLGKKILFKHIPTLKAEALVKHDIQIQQSLGRVKIHGLNILMEEDNKMRKGKTFGIWFKLN